MNRPHPEPGILDGHVHLLGDGSSGSGCVLRLESTWRRWQARALLAVAGLPQAALRGGLDELYLALLDRLLRTSSLSGLVLLAHDWPHDAAGRARPDWATFHVPNDYLLRVAAGRPEIIPAVSIHPGRADALEELDRCRGRGARMVKLLPNGQNIDCADRRYRRFWERLAEHGLPLLVHTGGERSVPVVNSAWGDPARLVLPLECGVTVIAAHCGAASAGWWGRALHTWRDLLPKYPRLYGDLSAFAGPGRAWQLAWLRRPEIEARLIHGSDFPIPVWPAAAALAGQIRWGAWRRCAQITNPLERDWRWKSAAGFPPAVFTRLHHLLPPFRNPGTRSSRT